MYQKFVDLCCCYIVICLSRLSLEESGRNVNRFTVIWVPAESEPKIPCPVLTPEQSHNLNQCYGPSWGHRTLGSGLGPHECNRVEFGAWGREVWAINSVWLPPQGVIFSEDIEHTPCWEVWLSRQVLHGKANSPLSGRQSTQVLLAAVRADLIAW